MLGPLICSHVSPSTQEQNKPATCGRFRHWLPGNPADPLDRQATKSGPWIYAATKLLCSVIAQERVLLLHSYSSSLPQDRYELARPPRFVVLEYC